MKVRGRESVRFSSYVSFCNVLHICNMLVRDSMIHESVPLTLNTHDYGLSTLEYILEEVGTGSTSRGCA